MTERIISSLITSSDLAEFAAVAKAPPQTEIVAEHDKFLVRVTIKNKVRTLASIIKGKTLHERKFPTLGAASAFLIKSNILKFEVNAVHYSPPKPATRSPANQVRMREVHKIAKHTQWLQAEVEASRADPRPSVSNEEADKLLNANLERLRARHAGKAVVFAGPKKMAEA